MVSLLPTFLYGKDKDGIFVNQYAASTIDTTYAPNKSVRLRQDTRYPESTEVAISIKSAPSDDMTIRLRMPGWYESPEVSLNEQPVQTTKPGSYLDIKRVWKGGDSLKLNFPMKLKRVRSDALWKTLIRTLPGGELMHEPAPNTPAPYALTRGPVVYAVDTLWWDDPNVPAPANAGDDLGVKPDLDELREVDTPEDLIGPTYEAGFVTSSGKPVRVRMVPFTNIGHWYRKDQPMPDRHASAYSYAIWMQSDQSPVFLERVHAAQAQQQQLDNAIDYVLIGDHDSEASHNVQGGSTGVFNDKTYRHRRDFSYQLRMLPQRDGKLIVTYWGGDSGRSFKITANERELATQTLANNKPGDFFEVMYTIPVDLIAGKTNAFGQKVDTVRVRFVSANQDVAGGVFGIRVE